MKKFSIISLGCPKNLVDSEKIVDIMCKKGYVLSDDKLVDTVIINTCSFIKAAVNESDSVIREQLKLKKDKKVKRVFVAGCLVSRYASELEKKYPDVDKFINTANNNIFLKNRKRKFLNLNIFDYHSRFILTKRHVAYIKISDGCDNFCSYCTIPLIKGRFVSRRISDIIDEVKALSDIGVKELIVISQDTLRYGIDIYGKSKLLSLLEKIQKIKGIDWIRLMYLYPSSISPELIKFIKNNKKILHYFDLPIQHVSNKILRLMNRRYDYKSLKKILDIIYKEIEDACIRTNFIVGFPYEDENDFKELKKFISIYPFSYINVFKYSREKDTTSYNFYQNTQNAINERYKELVAIASRKIDEFNKRIKDKEFTIIADTKRLGRSYMDAPDIDGFFETNKDMLVGSFYKVSITKIYGLKRRCILI